MEYDATPRPELPSAESKGQGETGLPILGGPVAYILTIQTLQLWGTTCGPRLVKPAGPEAQQYRWLWVRGPVWSQAAGFPVHVTACVLVHVSLRCVSCFQAGQDLHPGQVHQLKARFPLSCLRIIHAIEV